MPPLPVLNSRRIIAALKQAGFEVARQKGSHVRLRHADDRGVIICCRPAYAVKLQRPYSSINSCGNGCKNNLLSAIRRNPKNNQGEIILFFGLRLGQFRVEHLFIFPKLPNLIYSNNWRG